MPRITGADSVSAKHMAASACRHTIGGALQNFNLEAVQEFKIQSGSYNAEYGRSAGGQFNMLTKSGTNRWRGSAYGFFRDAALDAKNYFDSERTPFKRNQFGVFGGVRLDHPRQQVEPRFILKNKRSALVLRLPVQLRPDLRTPARPAPSQPMR